MNGVKTIQKLIPKPLEGGLTEQSGWCAQKEFPFTIAIFLDFYWEDAHVHISGTTPLGRRTPTMSLLLRR